MEPGIATPVAILSRPARCAWRGPCGSGSADAAAPAGTLAAQAGVRSCASGRQARCQFLVARSRRLESGGDAGDRLRRAVGTHRPAHARGVSDTNQFRPHRQPRVDHTALGSVPTFATPAPGLPPAYARWRPASSLDPGRQSVARYRNHGPAAPARQRAGAGGHVAGDGADELAPGIVGGSGAADHVVAHDPPVATHPGSRTQGAPAPRYARGHCRRVHRRNPGSPGAVARRFVRANFRARQPGQQWPGCRRCPVVGRTIAYGGFAAGRFHGYGAGLWQCVGAACGSHRG